MPFMLDIETSGLDKVVDDVLQVAALKLDYEYGYYKPVAEFSQLLPTHKEPSDYAKKFPAQMKLYEKCHELNRAGAMVDQLETRTALTTFLGPKAEIIGINVTTFDLKFLESKGYLQEKDYHYQVFDMTGIIEYLLKVLGLPGNRETRDLLKSEAKKRADETVVMPDGLGEHEGLYDCYDQTRELNGYLMLARQGFPGLAKP